jgi:glycine/D-amino acid oxidase-like deaminating enzyme
MSPDLFTADFKSDPFWWEASRPVEVPLDALPETVDVLVIGSGYTGLHAALQTARAGRSTLVLDKDGVGHGCSTRNGGQISTSVKPGFAALSHRYGPDIARAILQEGRDALAWIGEFIRDEAIDCDFSVCGRFHAAHSAKAFDALRYDAERQPAGLEVPMEIVPRDAQRREIGTDAYHGGVVLPKHAVLDPARYHAGLLARVRASGGLVAGYCAVTGLRRDGTEFEVTTSAGRLRARDVVVATNGYTDGVTPWLRRRIIPIGSYVIATEPMPPDVMRKVIPYGRIVSDTRKVVYYYRLSPDGRRMIFGGRVSHAETDPRLSGPRLHAEMAALFPQLRDARISHSWMGYVGYTFDTLAHTGRHEGMHFAMGYCGSGVSMASWLGMKAGLRVLGSAAGATAFEHPGFPTRPLYSGRPWFLAGSVLYYRLCDRLGL